jgi:hypothetical protein
MSELILRGVDEKLDAALDKVSLVDPRIAKVISDLDLKEIDWKNPLPHALRVSAYIQTTFADLKGKDKLDILKSVLKEVLAKTEISEEERTTALRFVDEVLPVAMSAAVMVAKGDFDLKKKVREVLENPAEVAAVAMPYCLACWGFVKRTAAVAPPPVQTPKDPLTSNPMHKPSA